MFVKPKFDDKAEEGLQQYQVWDPAQRNWLPAEGREVGTDHEHYWTRASIQGDVTILSAEDGAASVAAADAKRAQAAAEKAKADKAAPDAAKTPPATAPAAKAAASKES